MRKVRRRVKLPDGRIGTVVEEHSGDGFDYVVVRTDEGHTVTSHPIRLAPVRVETREESG